MPTAAYWGLIVASMCLMAAGTGVRHAARRPRRSWARCRRRRPVPGSAVNDTTREVGGTLGVAVVGSVMASVYAPGV